MICSADEFIQLRASTDPEEYLRAATEEAPIEVWHELIELHPDMRSWVAHNKTVPPEILAILAGDTNDHVRHTVARKNKLSMELMLQLAQDPDASVRQRIAWNKNASKAVLEKLLLDPEKAIAAKARERLASTLDKQT
jgi:hypothetical protein